MVGQTMTDDLSLELRTYEREFWHQYMNIRALLGHRRSHRDLAERLRREEAIPELVRDSAVNALMDELHETRRTLSELLLNFITTSVNGLHRVDVEFVITVISPQVTEISSSLLVVDSQPEELPIEIGHRFAAAMAQGEDSLAPDTIRHFYLQEETRYDMLYPGSLDRCSLQILEEIYPGSCHHIRIRLPAQVLIEHHIEL
jgi:hypothetical protein